MECVAVRDGRGGEDKKLVPNFPFCCGGKLYVDFVRGAAGCPPSSLPVPDCHFNLFSHIVVVVTAAPFCRLSRAGLANFLLTQSGRIAVTAIPA